MKLRDFLPDATPVMQKEQQLNLLTGLLSDLSLQKSGQVSSAQTLGIDQAVVNSWLRQQIAYRRQMLIDLMTIALTLEEIRSPVTRVVSEVFRKGIEWQPRFAVKCTKCDVDHGEDLERCTSCGSSDYLVEPDEAQKERPEEFMESCNIFDQGVEEVLRQVHWDVNVVDDGYVYIAKEYLIGEDGSVRSKPLEIRRLNPALVELDLDNEGLPNNTHFICYLHRDNVQGVGDSEKCSECGGAVSPAMYSYWHRGQPMYLLGGEVIHLQKFQPSETYGWSPILTIFEKALSIRGMDSFLYRYFFERKMPSSMIMVFTDDAESLKKEREHIAARMKLDPHYIPMVAVSSRNQRGRVDMVRLFHTLQEMDYLPVRQEIRERIADMWGVTPVWQGSPDSIGGLSTSTPQLTVMSRVIESDQRIYNKKVMPLILKAFGVTDWDWVLTQPEEKAEATKIAFAQQRVGVANMLFQMGFDIRIKSEKASIDDIEFVVSGKAKRQDAMGGGFPPMGGGVPSDSQEEGAIEEPAEESASPGNATNQQTWVSQMEGAGFSGVVIKAVNNFGNKVYFQHSGRDFVANFQNGILKDVANLAEMHQHDNLPPHLASTPHERKNRFETEAYQPEEPEDLDD